MRKAWTVLALLPLLMAGQCSNGARVVCPTITQYSPAFQEQFAAELEEIKASNKYPAVEQVIRDANVTRDVIRACKMARSR